MLEYILTSYGLIALFHLIVTYYLDAIDEDNDTFTMSGRLIVAGLWPWFLYRIYKSIHEGE